MKKKLLSSILVICMILSMLPVTAFAAEDSGADHKHEYTELVGTLKAPTCTSTGIGQYACSCGAKTYLTMPAAHKAPADASQITIVEPTCVENGSKKYTCAACGEPVEEVLKATGKHNFEQGITEVTCTKAAFVAFICTVCGGIDESREPQPVIGSTPEGHDFVLDKTAKNYKAATCTEAGLNVYVCQREDCDEGTDADGHGKTYTEVTEALGHQWDDGVAVEASCASAAGVKKTCQREGCDATSFEAFTGELADPQKAHTWVSAETIDADCENEIDGRSGGQECSVCHALGTGAEEDGGNGGTKPSVTPWAHTPENKTVTIKPATCKEGGIERTDSVCSVCKKTLSTGSETPTAKLEGDDAHTKVLSGTPLKAATCTSTGIGQYVCSVCGEKLGYQTIPMVGHTKPTTPGSVVTVPSTCLKNGSETYTCTVCKEEVTDELELADHDFSGAPVYTATIDDEEVELTAAQAAAYTCVDVTKTWTCATEGCGNQKTETVKATADHNYKMTYDQSDCTVGTIVYEACTVCGTAKDKGQNLGDKEADHKWVLDKTNPKYKAATCKEAGLDTFKCGNGNCEATKEEPTAKLEHTWNTGVFIEATCENNAGTRQTCTVCGETQEHYFTDDEATAFGPEYLKKNHSYSEEAVAEVPATCTTDGMAEHYTCKNCDGLFTKNAQDTYTKVTAEDLKIPASGHDVVDVAPSEVEDKTGEYAAVPATCKTAGYHYTVKICSVCGKPDESTYTKVEDPIDKEAHAREMTGTPLKQMNCATNTAGIAQFTCSLCGAKLGYQTIPVVHSYQNADGSVKDDAQFDADASTPATCTDAGENVYKCTNTGCTHTSEPIAVDALGHDFPTAVETTRPTGKPDCQDCEVTVTCKRDGCDVTSKVTIEASGAHTYVSTTTDATCLHGPITGYVCSKCNAVDESRPSTEDKDGALGHHWVADPDDPENAAVTCTTDGKEVYVCDRENCDGDVNNPGRKVETVKSTGHTWGNQVAVSANCEHGAGVSQTCSVCGTTEVEEFTGDLAVAKKNHSYVDAETFAATCTEDGVTGGMICEFCGEEDPDHPIQKDPATGHTSAAVVRENEVAATCSAKGSYDEVVYCETCGEEVSRKTKEISIDENNHVNLTATSTLKQATCTATGIGAMHCNDCDQDVGYQSIPMKDHTVPASGVEVTPATCETAGSKTYTCTVCHKEQTETIEALGHDYSGTPEYSSNFTCQDRTATYTCANGCGMTKTETVKATTEHRYEVKTIPATCTAPEQFGYICKDCGAAKGKMETVLGSEALAHDFDTENPITTDEHYVAATCTQGGTDVYKCKNCDELTIESTDPLGHDYGEGVLVEPTCEDGNTYVVQTCRRAGCDAPELKTPVIESKTPGAHKLTATAAKTATCTEDGNIAYWTCSVCKKVFSDAEGKTEVQKDSKGNYVTVVEAAHTYDEGIEVPATCEKAAHTLFTCTVCDENTEGHTLEVPAEDETLAPHVPNEEALTASTAYQDAACGDTVTFTSFTCKNCGQEITEGDSLTVTKAHVYDNGVVTTKATCQAAGVKTYTCTNSSCTESITGHTKIEEIAKLDHTFPTVTRPADWPACKDYVETVTCTTCQDGAAKETKEVTIDATAEHNYAESFVGDGEGYDCTKGVYAGSICTNCGAHELNEDGTERGNYLPGTKYEEHDYVIDADQEVNCIGGGEYTAHCSHCNAEGTVTVAGGRHKFAEDDKGTVEGATCTDAGKLMKTCTVCGKIVEDESYAGTPAGHENPLTLVEIPATCETEAATIAYCSKCLEINRTTGEVISGEIDEGQNYIKTGGDPITSGAHQWDDGTVTKAATCTETGTKTFTCSVCHATKIETTDALGHDLEVETIEATCTTGGYTITTCKRSGCDYRVESEKGEPDPSKHNIVFNEGDQVLKQPTCTDTGIGMGTCANEGCTYKGWAIIPKLEHDLETTTVAATCTEAGSTTKSCKNCDYTETEEIPALGHNYVFERGKGFVCSRCGETKPGENSVMEELDNPEIFEVPAEPITPEVPAEPVTPEDPAEPVTPEDPAEPVTPEDPAEPVTPEDPAEPVTPEDPAEPVTPEDPAEPVTPEDPAEPVTPEDPAEPVTPEVSVEEAPAEE